MTDPKRMKPAVTAADADESEALPPEEEVTAADVEERIDLDPTEEPSRPEQPDFDAEERAQFQVDPDDESGQGDSADTPGT